MLPHNSPSNSVWNPSRRRFLKTTGAATAGAMLVSARVLGRGGEKAPSARPVVAGVGVGGVGFSQLQDLEKAGFQVSALCDVDDLLAKKAFDRWPQAARYRDYRDMLSAQADKIDVVHVATPDHTHALITLAALRRKKHVCCVKPLTRTIHEGRVVLAAAEKAGVATQMTAAPYTTEEPRRLNELLDAGVIGAVREVHIWTNRPVWPQGMGRPAGEDPVPPTFDWKMWLGPAPMRPFKKDWSKDAYPIAQLKASMDWVQQYHGVYHPFNFRGWWDFGTGALGDMGCHHFNPAVRALKLGPPSRIEASTTKVTAEATPLASMVTYDFAARGSLPAVRLVWYDGGLHPSRPVELAEALPEEGALYLGDQGWLLYAGREPKFSSPKLASRAKEVPVSLPRRSGTWGEFFDACSGGERAGCEFRWAVPLTELVLLGNIAVRTGERLVWDSVGMKFSSNEVADGYLKPEYHNGWSLDG